MSFSVRNPSGNLVIAALDDITVAIEQMNLAGPGSVVVDDTTDRKLATAQDDSWIDSMLKSNTQAGRPQADWALS